MATLSFLPSELEESLWRQTAERTVAHLVPVKNARREWFCGVRRWVCPSWLLDGVASSGVLVAWARILAAWCRLFAASIRTVGSWVRLLAASFCLLVGA